MGVGVVWCGGGEVEMLRRFCGDVDMGGGNLVAAASEKYTQE